MFTLCFKINSAVCRPESYGSQRVSWSWPSAFPHKLDPPTAIRNVDGYATRVSPAIRRLRRAFRHPPSYVAKRSIEEARREFDRRALVAAQRGGGSIALGSVPGGLSAAEALTAERVASMAPWRSGRDQVAADDRLRDRVAVRSSQARARRMELFGDAPIEVTAPIAWHVDPRSGLGWPNAFHRRIEYVNLDRPSDVKVAWELSRLRHLVALAQGAAVLDESAGLDVLEADLVDWIRANPVGWSVNWTCAMEVALRAVNLICVDGILHGAGLDAPFRGQLVGSLYQHGWFLVRNLELSAVNGNHFLADAVGLVWLGRYFEGVGESARWLATGRAMIAEAAEKHVLADGIDQEGSLRYQALVLEMFLAARAVDPTLASIDPVLSTMLDATAVLADRSGRLPNIGDDDGGRALALCDAPSSDARRVLALGAALLDHEVAAHAASGEWPEDATWLTGKGQSPTNPRDRPGTPRWFRDAGIVVLGDGNDHIVVDVGPIGFRGRGGHGHVDAMSFEATLGGRIVVPDSGTASYTGDPALRNELRDVGGHTLIVLDDQAYARIGDHTRLWAIDGDAPPTVESIEGTANRQVLVVSQSLSVNDGPRVHVRKLEWSPGSISCADTIVARLGSEVCCLVQLPCAPTTMSAGVFDCDDVQFTFTTPEGAELVIVQCRHSERYGSVERGFRAEVRWTTAQTSTDVLWKVTR